MSLQAAAKHLATHGRGPDTHLVHMSGKELRGLQGLAKASGTSLSINPKTGLPEAGKLDSLLPMLAGAASTYFTGSPYLGMALAGGAAYGKNGDLRSGLMAGLGAYAGGSMMGAGMGGAAPTELAPVTDLSTVSGDATMPGALAGQSQNPYSAFSSGNAGMDKMIGADGMNNPVVPQAPNPSMDYANMDPNAGSLKAGQSSFGSAQFEPRPDVTPDNYAKDYTGKTAQSLKPEGSGGKQWIEGYDNKKLMGAALAGSMLSGNRSSGVPKSTSAPTPRYSFDQQTGRYTRLAIGGMAGGGGMFNYSGDTGPVVGMRTGGLSDLGGYSDGGRLLKGPGDGVSDSIPAMIGNKQPARLADGEFVVPARIVSEIGNGSTEAGARKLYAMMDRVQKARSKTTGKKQVAKNTRADKYLPA